MKAWISRSGYDTLTKKVAINPVKFHVNISTKEWLDYVIPIEIPEPESIDSERHKPAIFYYCSKKADNFVCTQDIQEKCELAGHEVDCIPYYPFGEKASSPDQPEEEMPKRIKICDRTVDGCKSLGDYCDYNYSCNGLYGRNCTEYIRADKQPIKRWVGGTECNCEGKQICFNPGLNNCREVVKC